MKAIQTEALTKSYGKARGIVDLDLNVGEGEFFGFIGPNGSGKSTTIRTLLGLISPTGGKAAVFGKDVVRNKKEILADVGYLPAEAVFYAGMRVRDILKFSADLRRQDCSTEQKVLCERLQLDVSCKVDELSFGNRKKVGIVCALQHKPRLLIFDEPTGGLDPLMQREFFSILRERNGEGTTIFFSSHILSEIQRNCRRAAIIREGKLIACDSVENLSKTSAKRVSVHGQLNINAISGARDVTALDGGVSFLYSADINELIRRLAEVNVSDLTVTEPDLEEIFMHYYAEGGDTK